MKLSIVIPTFNRCGKLIRLLRNIEDEVEKSDLVRDIAVLISDNGSTDSTREVLTSFKPRSLNLKIFRQTKNIGFDRNILFLYKEAPSDYVWFFADDDLLLPGAIARVIREIKNIEPTLLLFSFRQPPDSTVKTFNVGADVSVFAEPVDVIHYVTQFPKISIYVLKKTQLQNSENEIVNAFVGTNYGFIALAFSILRNTSRPVLAVIPDALATCDQDFNVLRFDPETWGNAWKVFEHPYVTLYCPGLVESKKAESYYSLISFLYNVHTARLVVEDPDAYQLATRKLPFRAKLLFRNLRAFLRFVMLKSRLVVIYRFRRQVEALMRTAH